jgi:hypothetical protein
MAESPFQFAGAVGDYLTGKARDIAETAPTLRDIGNAGIGAVDGVGLGLPSWAAGKLAGAQNPFALAKAESPNAYDIGELVSMVPLRTAALGGAASYGRRVEAAGAAQRAAAEGEASLRAAASNERRIAEAEARQASRASLLDAKEKLHTDPDVTAWFRATATDQIHRSKPVVTSDHINEFNAQFGSFAGREMTPAYVRKLINDHHGELKGGAAVERPTGLTLRSEKAKVAADPEVLAWANETAKAVGVGDFKALHVRDFQTKFGDRFALKMSPAFVRSLLNNAASPDVNSAARGIWK